VYICASQCQCFWFFSGKEQSSPKNRLFLTQKRLFRFAWYKGFVCLFLAELTLFARRPSFPEKKQKRLFRFAEDKGFVYLGLVEPPLLVLFRKRTKLTRRPSFPQTFPSRSGKNVCSASRTMNGSVYLCLAVLTLFAKRPSFPEKKQKRLFRFAEGRCFVYLCLAEPPLLSFSGKEQISPEDPLFQTRSICSALRKMNGSVYLCLAEPPLLVLFWKRTNLNLLQKRSVCSASREMKVSVYLCLAELTLFARRPSFPEKKQKRLFRFAEGKCLVYFSLAEPPLLVLFWKRTKRTKGSSFLELYKCGQIRTERKTASCNFSYLVSESPSLAPMHHGYLLLPEKPYAESCKWQKNKT
jgi:hypothetical protein